MSLQQLHDFKQWHLGHPRDHPVELWACDTVLACWVAGWGMLPAIAILDTWDLLPLSLVLTLVPTAYWALRRELHRRKLLRCDWLHTLSGKR